MGLYSWRDGFIIFFNKCENQRYSLVGWDINSNSSCSHCIRIISSHYLSGAHSSFPGKVSGPFSRHKDIGLVYLACFRKMWLEEQECNLLILACFKGLTCSLWLHSWAIWRTSWYISSSQTLFLELIKYKWSIPSTNFKHPA